MRAGFQLGYRPALDGLRAFAILPVLAFHGSLSFARGGFLGVDVFFVLSGFLITSLLLEEWRDKSAIRLGAFYARRALRLLPALFVLIAACAIAAALVGRPIITGKAAAAALLYAANWVRGFRVFPLGDLDHTWSLAIEEQFYLLWPPLLLLLLRRRITPLQLFALLLCGAAASAVARAVLLTGLDVRRVYTCLDTRVDSLLIGCATSVLVHGWALPQGRVFRVAMQAAALASAGLLALLMTTTTIATRFFYEAGGFDVVAVAAGLVIVAALDERAPVARLLALPPLTWIGRISYGLYLWHYPAYHFITGEGMSGNLAFALRVALTFAMAIASFFLVERPLLRLKRRFSS